MQKNIRGDTCEGAPGRGGAAVETCVGPRIPSESKMVSQRASASGAKRQTCRYRQGSRSGRRRRDMQGRRRRRRGRESRECRRASGRRRRIRGRDGGGRRDRGSGRSNTSRESSQEIPLQMTKNGLRGRWKGAIDREGLRNIDGGVSCRNGSPRVPAGSQGTMFSKVRQARRTCFRSGWSQARSLPSVAARGAARCASTVRSCRACRRRGRGACERATTSGLGIDIRENRFGRRRKRPNQRKVVRRRCENGEAIFVVERCWLFDRFEGGEGVRLQARTQRGSVVSKRSCRGSPTATCSSGSAGHSAKREYGRQMKRLAEVSRGEKQTKKPHRLARWLNSYSFPTVANIEDLVFDGLRADRGTPSPT